MHILDQLMERAGLEERPGLYIVPSKMMNAFAVGRKNNSVIAMTDKLVRIHDPARTCRHHGP